MLLKDADELKKAMERMLCTGKEPDKERYTCDVVCCVIDEAPSVDAEPVRHGRWIYHNAIPATCSVCGFSCGMYDDDSSDRYCSHCGAKMNEGADNANS